MNVSFADNLPAGMTVATPSNASTTCVGTLTADPGTDVVSYTGGTVNAGTSCTLSVDVTVETLGTFVNTTEILSSSLGTSAPATSPLVVIVPIPTLGLSALLLLATLLALLGLRRLRDRS